MPMPPRPHRKKRPVITKPLAFLGLAILLFFLVFTTAVIQDANLLRTSTFAPDQDDTDYTLVTPPDFTTNINEQTDICEEDPIPPTPDTGSDPSADFDFDQPSVLGINTCVRGTREPLPNPYKLKTTDTTADREVNAKDINELLATLCYELSGENFGKSLPECESVRAVGCAKTNFAFNPIIQGLIDIVLRSSSDYFPSRYAFFPGTVFGPNGESVYAPATYPAAPPSSSDTWHVTKHLLVWKLSDSDEELTTRYDSTLLPKLISRLKDVDWHERVHWEIYDAAFKAYLDLANDPPVPTVQGLRAYIALTLKEDIRKAKQDIKEEGNKCHNLFHDTEREYVSYYYPTTTNPEDSFACKRKLSDNQKEAILTKLYNECSLYAL